MSGGKKLVIYLPSMASGGAERLHLNLAPAFVAAGFDVTFLLHRAEGTLMPLIPSGVRVVSMECGRTLAGLWPLAKFLKTEKPDILLANLPHNNLLAIWAAALANVPTHIVASFHAALSDEAKNKRHWKYHIMQPLFRLFLNRAQGIVAVSEGVANDLAAATGLKRDRITAIYNPVIFPDFDAKLAGPCDHPWLKDGEPPVVLAVGRLSRQKDFPTLISAFALAAKRRDLRLMILGEGELRDSLLAQAEALGVADRAALPGFVATPLPYMKRAGVMVMSSVYEGFGNVLVEALACGTPVVSTDCPYGPAEILEHGRFGLLVPMQNPEAMADAMLAALDAPPPRDLLSARGREFTVQRAADGYIALFNRICAS